MEDRRGWTQQDYWPWRSHDHDRGVHTAIIIIHVAVADMDATYDAYVVADNNNNNNNIFRILWIVNGTIIANKVATRRILRILIIKLIKVVIIEDAIEIAEYDLSLSMHLSLCCVWIQPQIWDSSHVRSLFEHTADNMKNKYLILSIVFLNYYDF